MKQHDPSTLMDPFSPRHHWASHWHRLADRAALPAPGPLPRRVRFAIAGLGITGAAVALELTAQGVPADDVAILEAAHLAFGASGRNAGFVLSFPGPALLDWHERLGPERARELILLNVTNREVVCGFARERGLWHQAGGSYFLAASEDESAALTECHRLLEEAGVEGFAVLERLEAARGRYFQCLHQARDMGINPVEYVGEMLRASGVVYTSDCRVDVRGARRDGDFLLLETSRGALRADNLILASNAFSPLIHEYFADTMPITPARNQVVLVRPSDASVLERWGDGVYYANHGYDYWRALPGGLLLVGGGRNRDPETEQTWQLEENPAIVGYLEQTLVPALNDGAPFDVLHRWQGTLGMSPDGVPVAGFLPDTGERVSFAVGLSGYGLGFHRILARTLAGRLLRGEPLGVFGAERFANRGG